MNIDEQYILRCLELARKGAGTTRHNPLVGSVIVYDSRIIGEGYHVSYGEAHAEVNAINSVADRSLLPHSTLYVNLEPCSHFGKTPPCSLLIKEHKIKRVVVGAMDSNPLVSGKGLDVLREAGTEVITGVLEKECRELNRRFYTFHEKKRPYVILKWARTIDGFIDVKRRPGEKGFPNWITDHTARVLVHKWRSEEMSIMAGTNTIETDNPRLNLRYWPGISPLRIVPDRLLRLNENLNVFSGDEKTLVFTNRKKKPVANVEYITVPGKKIPLQAILHELYNRKISSVLVEGGAKLLTEFINSGLWDEARVFTGDVEFGEGIRSPVLEMTPSETTMFNGYRLDIFKSVPFHLLNL